MSSLVFLEDVCDFALVAVTELKELFIVVGLCRLRRGQMSCFLLLSSSELSADWDTLGAVRLVMCLWLPSAYTVTWAHFTKIMAHKVNRSLNRIRCKISGV